MSAISFLRTDTCAVVLMFSSALLSATVSALTLDEAEARALARNPALSAAVLASEAAEGEAVQAGLLPNPELSYSRENMGNSSLAGLDGPASVWQLSQRVEVSGGRGARRDGARAEAEAAQWRAGRARALLVAEVRTAWVEVVAAQQRTAFAGELTKLLRSTRDAVALQVKAGKVSPVELTRVEVVAAALQRRAQQAGLTLVSARQRLAGTQGLAMPDFGELPAGLPALRPLPSYESSVQRLSGHPTLRESDALFQARAADVRVARAARLPAPTFSVGQTVFENAGESAWQVGIGLPLPLFDRNQGTTRAAEARLQEARLLQDAATQQLRGELEVLYPEVQGLGQQLLAFEQSVLPASEEAFQAIDKGYRYGKFGLLDVLDAQRMLIDTRFDYLDTLTHYHRQRNRLDALLGSVQENPL